MEDEDMSHDAGPVSAFMPDIMDDYDQTEAGSQTATEQYSHGIGPAAGTITSADPRASAAYEQRRIRSGHGQRFRERSDSMTQRMADANFYNRFPDDFDEDDMKLPDSSGK